MPFFRMRMANARIAKVESTIESNDGKIRILQLEKTEIDKKHEKMLEKLTKAETRNAELEEKFDDLTSQKKDLTEESYELKNQHRSSNGGSRMNQSRIDQLERMVKDKEGKWKVVDERMAEDSKKVAELGPRVEVLEGEIDEEKECLKEVKEKHEESQKMIEELLCC